MRLRTRLVVGLGCAVLAAAGLVPAGARTAQPGTCAHPVTMVGLGTACPTSTGYEARLADGHLIRTHGPDMVDLTSRVYRQANSLTSAPLQPSCADNPRTQFHLRAIYAYPVGQRDRSGQLQAEIQKMLMQANGALDDEANKFGLHMSYRFLCAAGKILVDRVAINPNPSVSGVAGDPGFLDVVLRIRQAGYNDPLAKYMIWYDHRVEGKNFVLGGVADLIQDDHQASNNYNNYGARYTVVFGRRYSDPILPGGIVFLHESAHNFGLVSNRAPHGTGSNHCNDGVDVMCYQDASRNSHYTDRSCSAVTFDCGHNDYFNPRPSKSNFLATHWNMATPLNRFVKGCTYQTAVLTAPLPSAARDQKDVVKALDGKATKSFSISSSCSGHPYALSGVPVPLPEQTDLPYDAALYAIPFGFTNASQTRTEPQTVLRPEVDFNVCFYKKTALMSCAEQTGTDKGSIPSGATSGRVFLNAGANAIYVFNAI